MGHTRASNAASHNNGVLILFFKLRLTHHAIRGDMNIFCRTYRSRQTSLHDLSIRKREP
jgi:hypothetical protein